MYGVYNSDTLTELIDTVQKMYNTTMWKERTFVGRLNQWLELYLHQEGMHHYVKTYEQFLEELKMHSKVKRILSKGYLPVYLLPPLKLERILSEVRIALSKTSKDYDLVLIRLYLYYDMKLATFGIDKQEKSNCAIPSICTTIYPVKIGYVSN